MLNKREMSGSVFARPSMQWGLSSAHTLKLKKKWSDLKVEVKRRVSAHRRSVTATGGGTGVGELSPFDLRVAALIGDTSGVARN